MAVVDSSKYFIENEDNPVEVDILRHYPKIVDGHKVYDSEGRLVLTNYITRGATGIFEDEAREIIEGYEYARDDKVDREVNRLDTYYNAKVEDLTVKSTHLRDDLNTLRNDFDVFYTGKDDSNGVLDRMSELVNAIQNNKGSIDAIFGDLAQNVVYKKQMSSDINSDSNDTIATSYAVYTLHNLIKNNQTNIFNVKSQAEQGIEDAAAAMETAQTAITRIQNHDSEILGLHDDITRLQTADDDVQRNFDAHSERLDTHETYINDLRIADDDITTNIRDMYSDILHLNADVNDIRNIAQENHQDIIEHDEALKTLYNMTSELESGFAGHTQQIYNIEERVYNIENGIDTIFENLESETDKIYQTINASHEILTNYVNENVDAIHNDISSITSDIDEIESDLEFTEHYINTNLYTQKEIDYKFDNLEPGTKASVITKLSETEQNTINLLPVSFDSGFVDIRITNDVNDPSNAFTLFNANETETLYANTFLNTATVAHDENDSQINTLYILSSDEESNHFGNIDITGIQSTSTRYIDPNMVNIVKE